ncbi:MAG: hypothetical protein E4H23_09035 [Chrysiogenales bacterium]|nr:MAG: hypothetical protein E4H23_09035 [Chrysiogenales bacterium]
MNKSNYPILPVIAFFVLTLFVFGPGTIYLTNSVEFTNDYLDLLLVGICLALVFALVLWLIFLAMRAVGLGFMEKGLALLFGVAFLIWFQGNFLLWKYGPLDGRYIDWSSMKLNGYIDGGIWIGLLMGAIIFSSFFIKIAKRICLILIFVQFVYAAVLFFKQPEPPSFQQYTVDTADKFVFSKNKNLIMVILDAFQTDVFNEIIHENPGMSEALDGFTYYRNSLGGYPATELSVALMLTGKYYDNSIPFEQWKKNVYSADSIPSVLKSAGWQVDIYPDVSYSLYYSDKIASNFIKGVPLTDKIFSIAQIYDIAFFRCLPHFLKPRVYNDQAWLLKAYIHATLKKSRPGKIHSTRVTRSATKKKLKNRFLFSRTSYKRSPVIRFFDQMLYESSTIDNKGSFKFYHIMMPHIPLLLDKNLKFQKMEVTRQNYKTYATAAVKLMILFLEHLKEIGIYDDSLVVILGDHGAGHQGQAFELHAGMPMRENATVVTHASRVSAMPLVLVKLNSAHGSLQVSDAPVSHGDVPATVFSDLGFSIKTPGLPMQTLDGAAERERRFLIYAGRDIFSYYGDMTEYIVSGFGWFDESWRPSGRVFTRNGVVILNK